VLIIDAAKLSSVPAPPTRFPPAQFGVRSAARDLIRNGLVLCFQAGGDEWEWESLSRGVVLKKEVEGSLKQDLDKDF